MRAVCVLLWVDMNEPLLIRGRIQTTGLRNGFIWFIDQLQLLKLLIGAWVRNGLEEQMNDSEISQ